MKPFQEHINTEALHSCRYSTLTSLILSGGRLLSIQQPIRATLLKKMSLRFARTDAAILSELLNSMPSITDFELDTAMDHEDEMEFYVERDSGDEINSGAEIPSPATHLRQALSPENFFLID